MEAIERRKDGNPMAMRSCPDCGNPVSAKAPACPKCGRVLRKPPRQYGCVSGCLLIAAMGMVAVAGLVLLGPRSRHGSAPPPVSAPAAPARRAPTTGAVAVVELPGGKGTWIAKGDAWDEMLDAQNAQDTRHLAELIAAGKVLRVENGTRARVIESAALSRRVRVLDGPAAGEEGWIQAGFLRAP